MSDQDKELMGMVEVGDGTYLKVDADKIARWVMLVSGLIDLLPEVADSLKAGTEALGRRAQAQYVQLQSGDPVELDLRDLGGALDDTFPDKESKLTFVIVTGEVLFTCIDGPTVASSVLCGAIDTMIPAPD